MNGCGSDRVLLEYQLKPGTGEDDRTHNQEHEVQAVVGEQGPGSAKAAQKHEYDSVETD